MIVVRSAIVPEEGAARWEIQGFSLLCCAHNTKYASGPLLRLSYGTFSIELYPGGCKRDPKHAEGQVSVYLRCDAPEVRATYSIEAINRQPSCGRKIINRKPRQWATTHEVWGFTNFHLHSDLVSPNSGFLVNDTLTLELQVKAWRDQLITTGSCESMEARRSALAADSWALFESGEGVDVTLRCQGSEFRAHRGHLAARSPVFRRMLFGGMREAGSGEIVFEDIEPRAVAWFLRYIYTDDIESEAWEDDEALCHLLALAHKYEVQPLLECCEARLVAKLGEESAAERLMMAEHLEIPSLRAAVLDYICSTKARLAAVQGTDGFERLARQRPQLALAVLAKLAPPTRKRPAEEPFPRESEGKLPELKLCEERGIGSREAQRLRTHARRAER
mmetsp:Transcript_59668/g.129216  ORF Transcript_59668/g.129216 Transcript_59668/m.129216 type:complete len:391 (+) Transcript_59668:66-1238(+)